MSALRVSDSAPASRCHFTGLVQACKILKPVAGIAQTEFTSRDVVRHPMVARIVDAYARAEAKKKK